MGTPNSQNLLWINVTFFLSLCIVLSHIPGCFSIAFDVAGNSERCLREDLSRDVLVVGQFSGAQSLDGTVTSFKIVDPSQTELYSKDTESGSFAFTTAEGGEFQFCFKDVAAKGYKLASDYKRRVSLDLKTGVEARDYSEVATKENLNKLEVSVLRMEDEVKDIMNEMKYMRKREERMRNTNESTNARVLWLSLFSLAVLVALGLWQIFYLKRYFRLKKLL